MCRAFLVIRGRKIDFLKGEAKGAIQKVEAPGQRISYINLKNHIGDPSTKQMITVSVLTQLPQLTSPGSKHYVWLLSECSIKGKLCMWEKQKQKQNSLPSL